MASLDLRVDRGREAMFRPSMVMVPWSSSMTRNSVEMREDFPAPAMFIRHCVCVCVCVVWCGVVLVIWCSVHKSTVSFHLNLALPMTSSPPAVVLQPHFLVARDVTKATNRRLLIKLQPIGLAKVTLLICLL